MGMFDTLLIDPAMSCEECGELIKSTQTKEFDSLLITYQKGDVISSSSDGIFTGELYCKNYKNHKQLVGEKSNVVNKIFIVVKYNLFLGIERTYEKANKLFLSLTENKLDEWIEQVKNDVMKNYTRFKRTLVVLQELEGIHKKNLTKKELLVQVERIQNKIVNIATNKLELFPLEEKPEKILMYKYLWSKKINYDHLVYKIKRYIEEYQEILNLTDEELESLKRDKERRTLEQQFEKKLESLKETPIHSNFMNIWKRLPFFKKDLEIAIYQELVAKLDEQEALHELHDETYSNDLALELIKDLRTFDKTLQILNDQEEKLQIKFELFYKKPEKLLEKDSQNSSLSLSLSLRIWHLKIEDIEKQDIYNIILKDIQDSEEKIPDNPLKSMFF